MAGIKGVTNSSSGLLVKSLIKVSESLFRAPRHTSRGKSSQDKTSHVDRSDRAWNNPPTTT